MQYFLDLVENNEIEGYLSKFHKVGTEEETYMCGMIHDILLKRFGERLIYDCASRKGAAKLSSDFEVNGEWQFPEPVSIDLQLIQNNLPNVHFCW